MRLTLPFLSRKPPLGESVPAEGAGPLGAGILGARMPFFAEDDGGGVGPGTYRRMLRDPQVKACLSTKKFAVLSQGWTVRAGDDTAGARDAAAFARDALGRMRGSVPEALSDLLDALGVGVSLLEIVYRRVETGPHAGRIGLDALKPKDPAGFTFETDGYANVLALRGRDGAAYAPDKFLRYAYAARYGAPTGQSDLRAAYGPWRAKQQLLGYWAKYLEKFGMPTVTGSYDPARGYGTDQQRELLRLISQVHNESALVVPSDMKIGLLETARAQSAGFAEAVEYLDRAIAKSILGQTLTTDGAGGATYALGSVHQDVLGFHLEKVRRDLEETVMTAQLLAPLTLYNFGPDVPAPRFALGVIDEGRLQTAGRLIADLVAGKVVAPDEPWIRTYLGLPGARG